MSVEITGRAVGDDVDDTDYTISLTVEVSLRDLFAMFALAGFVASTKVEPGTDLPGVYARLGASAYALADAAIGARAGTRETS